MPYADAEKKLGHMKLWRKRKMDEGYGKYLYQRRKLRFDDAARFQAAIEEALTILAGRDWENEEARIRNAPAYAVGAVNILYNAVMESRAAEEALGPFVPDLKSEIANL